MYDKGYGVRQDYMTAMRWYRRAAEAGPRRRADQTRAHVRSGQRRVAGLLFMRTNGSILQLLGFRVLTRNCEP